jgi:hypothetical protein
MVTRPSSPERRRSSSARKSVVARLAAGARVDDGAHGTVSERECITDGTGAPPEWFARHPPRGDVLIATTMS